MEKKIFKFKNAVYWYDGMTDDVKADFQSQVLHPCKDNNIILVKYRFTEFPQVLQEQFDALFFDWGGMMQGNSMMEHFCNYILENAEDHNSRYYIMVSAFTKYAMKDAIDSFGENKPFNVFLTIEDFKNYLIINGQ